MSLNDLERVWPLFCVILTNLVALGDNVKMVEDAPLYTAKT